MELGTTRDKILWGIIGLCVITIVVVLTVKFNIFSSNNRENVEAEVVVNPSEYLYGICIDSLKVEANKVENKETLSTVLDRYGVTQATVNKMVEAGKDIFDARKFKGGNNYTVLSTKDSLSTIQYFIYEVDAIDYIVFNLADTIAVTKGQKEIEKRRLCKGATIESSLWNAMINEGMDATLAMNLSDVYQWSIDFYGIQKGDSFKVVYDELYVDDESIGIGNIYGAWFNHGDKKHYAIYYEYSDEKGVTETGYWDEEGKSLKSQFLKAPLKYSRISSKFSYSRLHPVLRIRRPHLGVDYAAPSGTPVQAIADGVIIARAYAGGNGNYIKIKHAQNYSSGYLHLKGFAKGIVVGKRVKQGELIGYVGSTGTSTGPHLDFRIWHGSKAIDPLKLTNVKREDLASKYKPAFLEQKERILAELEGREYIPQTDSTVVDSIIVISDKKTVN